MRRSSWIVLAACVVLAGVLWIAYIHSQPTSPILTQEGALQMVHKMQDAAERKDVGGIMDEIAPGPDVRIAGLDPDQLRMYTANFFRRAGEVHTDISSPEFRKGAEEATLSFNLVVAQRRADMVAQDYAGHVTLHLQRVDVPHLLNLYHTREWRIVNVETPGLDLSTLGDYY